MNEMETLKHRLEAAERVCLMVGWTAADNSERGKALHELWLDWLAISGASTSPADHPELSDERISELALRRDEKRAAALGMLP